MKHMPLMELQAQANKKLAARLAPSVPSELKLVSSCAQLAANQVREKIKAEKHRRETTKQNVGLNAGHRRRVRVPIGGLRYAQNHHGRRVLGRAFVLTNMHVRVLTADESIARGTAKQRPLDTAARNKRKKARQQRRLS